MKIKHKEGSFFAKTEHGKAELLYSKIDNATISIYHTFTPEEDRGKGIKYIVDFSVLPDYQGKGIGRSALEQINKMTEKLTAITRKETLHFFLKSGFVLRKTLKNYYYPGVDGYYIAFERKPEK